MIQEIWEEIAENLPSPPGWYVRRMFPDACTDILASLKQPGAIPSLLLEVSADSIRSVVEYPSSKGFEVLPEPIESGRHGRVRLCLVLVENQYRDVFGVLADDVAQSVAAEPNDEEAVSRLLARLYVWQTFMSRHEATGLSLEAQIGLFGELLVLERWLLTWLSPEPALDAWTGPRGGIRDFELPEASLEVKTTTVLPPRSVRIPNLVQLDETTSDCLLLCHFSLATTGTDGRSLADLVEDIRQRVEADDQGARQQLEDMLIEAGYLDNHAGLYANIRYTVRGTRFFQVEGDFPRLTPADVGAGIEECSYSIQIGALNPYELDMEEALGFLMPQSSNE